MKFNVGNKVRYIGFRAALYSLEGQVVEIGNNLTDTSVLVLFGEKKGLHSGLNAKGKYPSRSVAWCDPASLEFVVNNFKLQDEDAISITKQMESM